MINIGTAEETIARMQGHPGLPRESTTVSSRFKAGFWQSSKPKVSYVDIATLLPV